jgi:hypothetical protein
MWICTNTGFVSVVQDWDDHSKVWVRARRRQDIEHFFGESCDITYTPDNDYAFRRLIEKTKFGELLKCKAFEVDYGNFKNSVPDGTLRKFYTEIWRLGYNMLDQWSSK